MRITKIKVFPVNGDPLLKAYAIIEIDSCFIVKGLKVIKKPEGYFVAMPAKKRKDGTYMDIVHPLDKDTRALIEGPVIEEYKRTLTGDAPVMATAGEQEF